MTAPLAFDGHRPVDVELLNAARFLSEVTGEPVVLGDVPHQEAHVLALLSMGRGRVLTIERVELPADWHADGEVRCDLYCSMHLVELLDVAS